MIIANDFVSLKNALPESEEPKYINIISHSLVRHLFRKMFTLRRRIRKLLKKKDFVNIHRLICTEIDYIIELETKNLIHIAMLKHILESVGFAAKNSIEYTKHDDNRVKKLAVCFIKTQMLGTILTPLIDRSANKIHKLGVGIIVNDVPSIPYKF